MPTHIPEHHHLRRLEGADTVPNPVPPQTYTLSFLAALVAVTYVGFFAVFVCGWSPV